MTPRRLLALLTVFGWLLVAAGVGMWAVPAGMVVAGLGMVAAGLLVNVGG